MTRVAVIGAGLSGLVAARELHKCNDVTVFEKSRGFGGRMATRYGTGFEFDHGAQFFVARSKRFQKFLEPLIAQGTVACWRAEFVELQRDKITATRDWDDDFPHYVGAPRMSAIGRYLADGVSIRQNTTVANIAHEASGWRLSDKEGNELGCFDWVVCALPAAQTAALVPDDSLLYRRAKTTQMSACYALMLGFDKPLSLPWQAARVLDADISWVSVNSSKPKRPDDFTLVAHSTNKYADANIDKPIPEVQEHLLSELSAVIGTDCNKATFCQLHRWRYANIDKQQGPACLVDPALQLAGCGDWFKSGRVEAAFTSGLEVSTKVPGTDLFD